MMTLENPGLPWLVSGASHWVALNLLSSWNSPWGNSLPTHKATTVKRKEPAENPCKLFSFTHSSLYPGDIKDYSELKWFRWFKRWLPHLALPPAATLVDLEESPPPVLPTSASFSGCPDCPHCFTGLPGLAKLFYRIAQLAKLFYDKESDHSYKAVRTCPQNSDG